MKRLLLLGSLAAAITCQAQWVQPNELPAGINVDPVQGRVITSGSNNPLGVKQITVIFNTYDIQINEGSDACFELFKEGVAGPVASTPVANSYLDFITPIQVGFEFPGNWTADGIYTVSIPAGAWTVGGAPTEAMTLRYEIFHDVIVSPATGVFTEVPVFSLSFPYADNVVYNGSSLPAEIIKTGSADVFAIDVVTDATSAQVSLEDAGEGGDGTYFLSLPDGCFTISYKQRPSDGAPMDFTMTNTDLLSRYYVTSLPAPAITPAPGEVEEFLSFTVDKPSAPGYTYMFADTMGWGYIYPRQEDGTLAANPLCRLRAYNEAGSIVLKVCDQDGMPVDEPLVPANGDYTVVLPEGLFFGMYNGSSTGTVPYQYDYSVNVLSGAANLAGTPAAEGIYTLDGKEVSPAADADAVSGLGQGVYIINGRATLVIK